MVLDLEFQNSQNTSSVFGVSYSKRNDSSAHFVMLFELIHNSWPSHNDISVSLDRNIGVFEIIYVHTQPIQKHSRKQRLFESIQQSKQLISAIIPEQIQRSSSLHRGI